MAVGKFQRPKKKNRLIPLLIILSVIVVGVILVVTRFDFGQEAPPSMQASLPPTTTVAPTTLPPTEATTAPPVTAPTAPPETTEPTDPPNTTDPYVVATASIGVTGDVLIHNPVFNAMHKGNGVYDFSGIFTYVAEYFENYDFMVANLEVPLAGAEAGYSGYPQFNCPDAIVDALADAGVDMLLSSNNHTYDQGHNGLIRTQEVIAGKGLLHLGTRTTEDVPLYKVVDINGIKVGMLCYTYETGNTSDGRKTLNGIPVKREDCELISSFHPNHLDKFYEEVDEALDAMYAEGAEVTIVYIHWGEEYQLQQNYQQQKIAENLCELGVDVIVGGHPHVIQPFEVLYSSTGHRTYCIYSVGNAISNQRRFLISQSPNGHTEDGMIFGVTFKKWNDGNVVVSQVSILPLWVSRDWSNPNGSYYTIVPLDPKAETWGGFDRSHWMYDNLKASYARTMGTVEEGFLTCCKLLSMFPMPATFE